MWGDATENEAKIRVLQFTKIAPDKILDVSAPGVVLGAMSRTDVPFTGDERALLTGWLDWHRETVHVKCAGLDEEAAWRTPLPAPSLTSAAGLVSHLTAVESYWFERILAGLDTPPHWTGEDPDLEWRRSAGATLAGTLRRYRDQCAVSRSLLDGVDLDGTCAGGGTARPCRSAGCFCT